MTCKGISIRHKAALNQYTNGQKCCQVCALFINLDGVFCPCCGYRLRKKMLKGDKRIVILAPSMDKGP
jgi:predicted amidophosphoribosyltransferase